MFSIFTKISVSTKFRPKNIKENSIQYTAILCWTFYQIFVITEKTFLFLKRDVLEIYNNAAGRFLTIQYRQYTSNTRVNTRRFAWTFILPNLQLERYIFYVLHTCNIHCYSTYNLYPMCGLIRRFYRTYPLLYQKFKNMVIFLPIYSILYTYIHLGMTTNWSNILNIKQINYLFCPPVRWAAKKARNIFFLIKKFRRHFF